MSDDIQDQDLPFEAENPSRRRVDRDDMRNSVQEPERETVEELTRGKRKKGKTAGFLLVVVLLGGGLYYLYGGPDAPAGRRRSVETLTPSETAGATVLSGAKAAEVQAEQERKQAAASAAAAAQGRVDPNAAATAAIGTGQGGFVNSAGPNQSVSQAAAAAEAAAKQEAKEKAEKEATIAASPLLSNDVQVLRSDDGGRPGGPQSAADQLAQSFSEQMKASQASADRQMDRVLQMSTSFGGQGATGGSALGPTSNASQQDQWLNSQKSGAGTPTKMHAAPTMPIVSEGTPVRSVLLTGLDTDNPGSVKAMVTSDIYDTFTGRILMIPKGSTLTGSYNHDVKVGQNRVLIAITRLIRPDGSWIDLSGTSGAEMDGTGGLESEVNNHFWKIFSSAMVVGAATLLLDKSQQTVTVNQGLGTSQLGGTIFAQTLQQVVSTLLNRNKDIPPTLSRSGGTEFIFMVRNDLALTQYYRR
ncbi:MULTISPECIES: TrbI/VirB10 family protein [unclassified Cupriavidus]|uniref:TrbI/VirB10 family protein n=1 Tax=unclassified Cupriavidus TaxID=2640874 RepID=UPI001AE90631|nr:MULTISPECIES: TrbI/VirB10 family protein [unclassified Cupriavidus]MBP0633131.1 TrbI/VirB10 family protein [Cupriavidus sp. AcVe19-1a]MBP0639771.1 TrbI/VirB10 family protein [Cupriavidus sp. AcVe19-6a]